jgi:hypothetical protein
VSKRGIAHSLTHRGGRGICAVLRSQLCAGGAGMNYLLRFGPTRVQLCSNIVFSKLLGEQEEHGTLTEAAVASAQFCAVL